jgi:hypothetical protein
MQRSKFDSYLGYTDRDGSLFDKAAPDPLLTSPDRGATARRAASGDWIVKRCKASWQRCKQRGLGGVYLPFGIIEARPDTSNHRDLTRDKSARG